MKVGLNRPLEHETELHQSDEELDEEDPSNDESVQENRENKKMAAKQSTISESHMDHIACVKATDLQLRR